MEIGLIAIVSSSWEPGCRSAASLAPELDRKQPRSFASSSRVSFQAAPPRLELLASL